jgi:hypothetical protein
MVITPRRVQRLLRQVADVVRASRKKAASRRVQRRGE